MSKGIPPTGGERSNNFYDPLRTSTGRCLNSLKSFALRVGANPDPPKLALPLRRGSSRFTCSAEQDGEPIIGNPRVRRRRSNYYPSSIGTINSTGSLRLEPAGNNVPPVCKSRQRSGPSTPLRMSTTRLLDRSTRTSIKLWKKGAWLKSKRPDKASTLNGQALNHLIQYQNGCFHSGISASIFSRRR